MMSGDAQLMNEAAASSTGLGLVPYIGYLVVIVCGLIPTRGGE